MVKKMDLIIKTEMYRNPEFESVIEFGVTAVKELDDEDISQVKVAGLYGLNAPLTFDGQIEDSLVDCFDARDGHALETYSILFQEMKNIEELLQVKLEEFWNFDSVLFLEEAQVDKEYRGHGVALRLMREVAYIFRNSSPLYILKAHPTGQSDEVTDDDCRKLGAYYMSDPALGFKELDPEKYAGWLVSKGAAGISEVSDSYFFETSFGT